MSEIRVKSTGTIKLFESDNTSSVTIASPASLGGDRTITIPDADVDLTKVNAMPIANLDIDGGTDIGAAIVDADLFIVDDGAGGTNRKTAASRLKTYIGGAVLTQVATLNDTNGSGSLNFASCFTSTYRNYFVVFDNIQVATNGADVNMLFHYGDSTSNDSTNHNYAFMRRYPSTTAAANENNGDDIKFLQAQRSGTGNYTHGTMYVFQPLNTTDGVTSGTIVSQGNTNDGAGAQITTLAFNMPESGTDSAYTGFQFAASSGNIQGRITVYGITNPA